METRFSEYINLENINVVNQELTPFQAVFFFVMVLVTYIWFYAIFVRWSGMKSKAQMQEENLYAKPDLYKDIASVLSYKDEVRNKLKPGKTSNKKQFEMLIGDIHTTPWNENIKNMWTLVNQNHKFKGIYDTKLKCWWGEDTVSNDAVVLICLNEQPSLNIMEDVISTFFERNVTFPEKRFKIFCVLIDNEIINVNISNSNNKIELIKEKTLLDSLVDFSNYRLDIKHRVNNRIIPSFNRSIEDVYTESLVKADIYSPEIPVEKGFVDQIKSGEDASCVV